MKRLILTSCLCVLFASCTALADWDVGDPYKMHFPQLPDPGGWDVGFSTWVPQLADDWLCTESGEVDDVHIWYSWEDDLVGTIETVQLGIWSNYPDPDGDGPLFSMPNQQVWGLDVSPGDFATRDWGSGKQGWYNPISGDYKINDHIGIYQLNVVDITEPFYQEEGEIYWLSVCFYMSEDPGQAGWKTANVDNYPEPWTGNHFMDDAVYWEPDGSWHELIDPITCESLDMAFVITPEPATVVLLGLGSLVLIYKRR